MWWLVSQVGQLVLDFLHSEDENDSGTDKGRTLRLVLGPIVNVFDQIEAGNYHAVPFNQ